VAESIFTVQTPAVGDANDGTSTLGTLFTVAVNGTIDGIRWFAPSTLPTGLCQALLYQWTSETTGTLLGQVAFNVTTPSTWNSVNFGAPINVVSGGQRYVAAVFTPDHYVFTNFFFTGSGTTNGNLTAPQSDNATPARNGKFIAMGFPQYPDNSFRDSCYFVDVLFTASVAPTGQTIPIDRADETDTAQAITPLAGAVTVPIGRSDETDTAQSITPVAGAVAVPIGQALEVDTAQTITPGIGAVSIPIGRATEVDTAQAITVLQASPQTIPIGMAEEFDTALPILVRVSGAKTPFFSGPCEIWDPIWCGELSTAAMSVTGDAVTMATEVLWQLSGQRFGLCEVTLRPCRNDCAEGYGTFDQWWPGVGGSFRSGGGPRPWWFNGVWANVCGGCGGSCSCTLLDEALLPAPTREVVEVRLDGIVMDPSLYRVDENRKLVRTDGQLWPMCQDMALDDSQPGTWSVTITVGEDVPALARRAVGELAAEFAKDCAGEECQVPYDVTSLNRQGISLSFGNPNVEKIDPLIRLLGLRMVRLFLATYNPGNLRHRGKAYDVSRMPRPWKRTNTS
jgi:hypothetical protein